MKRHPWLIPIPTLKRGENYLKFELDIEELGGTRQEVRENLLFKELVGPLRVELAIVRSGENILVNGRVRFQTRLVCAICGKEFEREFCEKLATEFISENDTANSKNRELATEELNRILLRGNQLNLASVVHDAIHLAIPIAPKCRPDCTIAFPSKEPYDTIKSYTS
ncbi:hypothetical protein CH330_03770 [candidate division WOR-3 bacterium JGI_Cruoil_03_51_56]|uniref:DUF177 domain-containing protein n=1 Tax=candidate division WOR-3 bacterium JGI_Cruoil_03_51_56 TaxID=1973747 RepID=A0A235BV47_UNCW3|nr:MAG: hypothetical protein CH330_03770 [candidate division WOR-3 bacterium JGI_Cruoil_03_51_56]